MLRGVFEVYTNMQLWKLAEDGEIELNSVFEDSEGNQIIFTGKSFQVYYSNTENKYVGMCVGDIWEFTGVNNE